MGYRSCKKKIKNHILEWSIICLGRVWAFLEAKIMNGNSFVK